MFTLPERLSPGDTAGIIAPASAPPDRKAIDRSLEAVERLGFKPLLASNARKRLGFLAGTDRERAQDLMRMFTTRGVKAIFCVRGGYGSARLLSRLDFDLIRRNPKIFVGYSDITSLHCALLTAAGLISFHGPMLNSDLIKPDLPPFTLGAFLRALTEPVPLGDISGGLQRAGRERFRPAAPISVLREGIASGPLIGGNLTLLCSTLGTPWQPPFEKAILFFEDLDEAPYRFDRMLTQLLNAGVLQKVAGVAIGINKGCRDPKARKAKEYRQTLEDVFRDRLRPLKVPVVAGLPFGHIRMNATLPIGVQATLNGNNGVLTIDSPAVK